MKNLLFIHFLIVLALTAGNAAYCAETGTENTRFIVQASGGVHIPLMQPNDAWKPYGCGGLRLEIPSSIPRFGAILSADAGILRSNTLPDLELKTIQILLGFNFHINILPHILALKPCAGFSSVTINGKPFELKRKVFANSESENGIFAGLEPVLSIYELRISVPIYGTYVLSSPFPFISASVSVNAGAAF
jgi:hypothetical protein